MATAPIDISLRVRGGKELDLLVKRMDKLEKESDDVRKSLEAAFNRSTFQGINRGTASLARFEREALDANKALKKLKASGASVAALNLSVAGAGAAGAGAGVGAVGAAVASGIQQATRAQKELNDLVARRAPLEDKIAASKAKQSSQEELLENAVSRQTRQQNYLNSLANKKTEEYRKSKAILIATNKEVNNLRSSQRGLVNSQGLWNQEIDKTTKKYKRLNAQVERQQAKAASKGGGSMLGSSIKGLLGVAAAYLSVNAAIQLVNKSIQVSSNTKSAELRIKALSAGFDNYGQVLGVVERAQAKFNIGNLEASNSVAQLYGRLRPLGLSLSEIETVYNGFNTAATLTGATAAESAGALLQLSQALGAGALRGEEFNSVAEQAPAVLQAIAKEVDKPVGQLKALAKEGKLTTDILLKALKRVEEEGADKLAAALDTPAQKFKTLQNRTEDLNKAFGDLILPAVISGVEGLSGAAEEAAKDINKTALAMQALNEKIQAFKAGNPGATKAIGDFGTAFLAASEKILPFLKQLRAFLALRDQLAASTNPFKNDGFIGPPVPEPKTSLRDRLGFDDDLSGGGGGGGGAAATPRASDAPQLQRDLQLKKELLVIDRSILEAQLAGNAAAIQLGNLQKIEAEFAKKKADILASERYEDEKQLEIKNAQLELEDAIQQLQFTGLELAKQKKEALAGTLQPIQDEIALLQGKLAGNEEEIRQLIEIRDLKKQIAENGGDPNQAEALVKTRNELKLQAEAADELKAKYEALANSIASSLTGAFKDVITGAKSAQEALSDAFAGIADAFLDMAMKMIQEWLVMQLMGIVGGGGGGGGGGLSSGMGGMFNLSGGQFGAFAEGGFVTSPTNAQIGEAGENEYVIPASKMNEAMGRYSNGSRGESVIPGKGGGSGGAGGGADGSTIVNYNGPTLSFNSEDYVPASAVPEIINAAAKRGAKEGEQRTFSALMNSRGQRSRIGL